MPPDKKWPTPPPGVSTLAGKPIEIDSPQIPPVERKRGRKRVPGDDVLKDPSKYKAITSTGMTPAGVERNTVDIREAPLPKTRNPSRNTASFVSVDGEEYTFRTHDTKGKPLPYRETMALFISIRELSIGGDAKVVLDAFKFKMHDMNGKEFYPLTDEIMSRLPSKFLPEPAEPEEEATDQDFSLGE